jgi:hypothetical protein
VLRGGSWFNYPDYARTGPALEAMYQFILWLIPAVDKFPRSQKFLLGDHIECTGLKSMTGAGFRAVFRS